MTLRDRFLRYVKIDTQSDDKSKTAPSSLRQLDLARLLVAELKDLGLQDATLNEYGIVYASLTSNAGVTHPIVGFLAHMDTALEMPGGPVKPRVIGDYDGDSIVLNKGLNIVLDVKEFPHVPSFKGKTLVVTDGTTLLGADDKAGIAIVMAMLEHLKNHPEIKHCPIRIAFTPDEEIGRGTDHFDVAFFGADFAYTVDGGPLNEINYENFNAASADVVFHGKAIHPGYAKGRMVNAQSLAHEFYESLPEKMIPELTDDYEGFHHLVASKGEVETAEAHYIVRDHDGAKLAWHLDQFRSVAQAMNERYGYDAVALTITDSYRNMRHHIEAKPEVLERAQQAFERLGIVYKAAPIRGGTDGARLTYAGLPCPNLGTGGYHAHGKYELAVLEEMETMVQLLIQIVKKQ